jgi:cytochrome oxidase assembly protein ShyY1
MLVALLIALAVAAGCVRLGVWQLSRATERSAAAARTAAAELAAAGPVGLGTIVPPQAPVPGDHIGRSVWVEGTYDPDGQRLVTGRAVDGQVGYLVLTPLHVTDDGTRGASWADLSGDPVLPVVRGWVASPDYAPGLAVPEGTVRLTGWLQAAEATSRTPVPDNPGGPPLTDDIASSSLVNDWGGPSWDGYVVMTSSEPAQVPADAGGPIPLPRPVAEGGTGLNLQSAFYALEWSVFALFALAFCGRLARDEVRAEREALAAVTSAGGAPARRRGEEAGIAGLPG